MTVKELKEKLDTIDDDIEVVLSIDDEGNGYNPLFSVDLWPVIAGIPELKVEMANGKSYIVILFP